MGKVADKTHLQIKMLNRAKGPAVQSLRAQGDKIAYPEEMVKTLESLKNLEIKEAMVEDLIVEDKNVKGVILENGEKIESQIVILTTGTYLKGDILVGTIDVKEDNSYFVISIPYDKGFTILVDNHKVEYEKVNDAFIGFKISKGNHNIEISYYAPFKKIGIIFSIIGMIIFLILLTLEKNKPKVDCKNFNNEVK